MISEATGRVREALGDLRGRQERVTPVLAGLISGAIGLIVSFGLRGYNLGRPLGDPVPMMLAVTQVPGGFTYFPWRPLLYHLIFASLLGFLALGTVVIMGKGGSTRKDATLAGRIAALLNVLVVAVFVVDAVVVGFWYLVSGFVSVLISGLVAGLIFSSWASWHNRRNNSLP